MKILEVFEAFEVLGRHDIAYWVMNPWFWGTHAIIA